MNVDQEPMIEEHKKHIEDIKNILDKEPKLKEDIKKIIVDQMVKAKIRPDQYQELSAKINSLEEIPKAVRTRSSKPRAIKEKQNMQADVPVIIEKTKTRKPRAKKQNMQSDVPVIINQEVIRENQILKPVIETQKKKRKIVYLD